MSLFKQPLFYFLTPPRMIGESFRQEKKNLGDWINSIKHFCLAASISSWRPKQLLIFLVPRDFHICGQKAPKLVLKSKFTSQSLCCGTDWCRTLLCVCFTLHPIISSSPFPSWLCFASSGHDRRPRVEFNPMHMNTNTGSRRTNWGASFILDLITWQITWSAVREL